MTEEQLNFLVDEALDNDFATSHGFGIGGLKGVLRKAYEMGVRDTETRLHPFQETRD